MFVLILICCCSLVLAKGRIGNVTFTGDDYTFPELKNCYLTTDNSGNLDCSTNQTGTGGSSTFNGYTNSDKYWFVNESTTKFTMNGTSLNITIEEMIRQRNTTAAASGVTQAYVDAAVKTNISDLNNTLRIDLNYTAKDGNLSIDAVTKVIQLDLWKIFGWGKYWFGLLNTTDLYYLDSRINNTNATIITANASCYKSAQDYSDLTNASMWTTIFNKGVADNSSATLSYRIMFVAQGSVANYTTYNSSNITCTNGVCSLNLTLVSKSSVDTSIATNNSNQFNTTGGTMAGNINMNSYNITNVRNISYADGFYDYMNGTCMIRVTPTTRQAWC